MPDEDEPEQVENQYKTALGDVLSNMRERASICGDAFDGVVTAMENGAWVSSTADDFDTDLQGHRSSSATAGEDCQDAFETRHDNEPDKVEEDDRRARWMPHDPYPMGGPH